MSETRKNILKQMLITCAVAVVAGLFTLRAPDILCGLALPPLVPPTAVFVLVWTLLYLAIGLSAGLLDPSEEAARKTLLFHFVGLGLNFLWPVLFFRLRLFTLAAFDAVLLLAVVVSVLRQLRGRCDRSFKLYIPYAVWLLFACYMSIGVAILN